MKNENASTSPGWFYWFFRPLHFLLLHFLGEKNNFYFDDGCECFPLNKENPLSFQVDLTPNIYRVAYTQKKEWKTHAKTCDECDHLAHAMDSVLFIEKLLQSIANSCSFLIVQVFHERDEKKSKFPFSKCGGSGWKNVFM